MALNQVQIDLLVNTVNTSNSLREVNLAMRQLSTNLAGVQQGSAAFTQMNGALSQGRERIEDLNAAINAGKDGGLQGLSNLGRNIAGSFGIATGALGLFGVKNEAINDIINKVNASVALLSGIQSLADAKRDAGSIRGLFFGTQRLAQTAATTTAIVTNTAAQGANTTATVAGAAATNTMTFAQRALNLVLKANPIALVISGIVALIAIIASYVKATDDAVQKTAEFNTEMKKLNSDVAVADLKLITTTNKLKLAEYESYFNSLEVKTAEHYDTLAKLRNQDAQSSVDSAQNRVDATKQLIEQEGNVNLEIARKKAFEYKNLTLKEQFELTTTLQREAIARVAILKKQLLEEQIILEEAKSKAKIISQKTNDEIAAAQKKADDDAKEKRKTEYNDYIKNLQSKLEAAKGFNDAISKIETFSIGETNKKALELNTKYLNDQQKIREAFNKRILAEKLITDEEFFKLDNEKQEKLLDIEIKFNEKQKGASDKDIAIAQFRRLKDIEKINEEYQSKIDTTLKGTDKVNTLIKARDLEISISQQANKRERTQLTKDLYTIEEEIASEGLSKLKELTDEFNKSSTEAKLVATNTEKNIEVKQSVDQLLIQASADEKLLRGTNKFLDDRLTLISNGLDQEILKSSEFGKDIIDLEEQDYANRKLLFGNAFNDSLYALNVQFDKKIITTEQYNEKLRKLESLNGELQNQLDANYYQDANEKLKNFRDTELNFNSNSLNKKLEQNKENLDKDLANVEEYALKRQKVISEDPNLSNDQKAFQSVSLVQEVEQLKTDAVRKASAERVKAVADEISSQVNLYGDLGKGVLDALGAISASKQAINTNQIAVENQTLEQNYNDQTDKINNAYASQIAAANGNADAIKVAEETKTKAFAEAARTKAIEDNKLIVRQNAINKEAFENSKKLQIAQAIIQTAQSATGAFASLAGIPLVGPVLGGIAAAAAIVSGTAQINTIRKTQYVGQSTSALPPAYVDSSSSGSGGASSSLANQFVGGFNFDNSSLFGQNYPFPQSDQRVYVLESDITSTQNRVKTIEDRNSF